MNRTTRLLAVASLAIAVTACADAANSQARETYLGGPLGYSSGEIRDQRADVLLDNMERDLSHVTGAATEVRDVALFTRPGAGTTYCGTVKYNNGPWVSFIMRSAPDLLIEPQIRSTQPQEIRDWRAAGCDRSNYILLARDDGPGSPGY
ncbi:hypothetical protein BAJUN_02780 [Bajunvirus bajun]|uniref:Lipoprotein n=1 Tax=Brevundimonas phage vB_BgoS-Bajun TaxID=2948594 RepID=A0A9E7SS39_9CAUD|nr:hypothetical protein BAJUN_02780 [Brevundimonas phage vB_BgoS-Bajun]